MLAGYGAPSCASDIAASQLPGQGVQVGGSPVVVGAASQGEQTLSISGTDNVIVWGGQSATINASGPAGFNIGSDASLTFAGSTAAGAHDAVLNIDTSGHVSQLLGQLHGSGNDVDVFVANRNGVVVGTGANLTVSGQLGLISHVFDDNRQADFDGSGGHLVYQGGGGDVTVAQGATLTAGTVLVSGGATVNVSLDAIDATSLTLLAGRAQGDGSDAATAQLDVSGSTAASVSSFSSAGDASSSGSLTVQKAMVDHTLVNTGSLDVGWVTGTLDNRGDFSHAGLTRMGALLNSGTFQTTGSGSSLVVKPITGRGSLTNTGTLSVAADLVVADGDLVNSGSLDSYSLMTLSGGVVNSGSITIHGFNGDGYSVLVSGGDLQNSKTLTQAGGGANAATLLVRNGSLINKGNITNVDDIQITSDTTWPGYTDGADYAFDNMGTVQSNDSLQIFVNSDSRFRNGEGNTSLGSFSNTGSLFLNPAGMTLQVLAHDALSLAGHVYTGAQGSAAALSADHPLTGSVDLEAGGALSTSTPLATRASMTLKGHSVAVMASASGGDVAVTAGAGADAGYAIRLARGAVLQAVGNGLVQLSGVDGGRPDVILQGVIKGGSVTLGADAASAVSNVFSGPEGTIVLTGDSPALTFNFTGALKNAKYTNSSNFRYNNLPITVASPDAVLALTLNPVAWETHGTSNGKSGVNLLVDGSVALDQQVVNAYVDAGQTVQAGAQALPNTHLVLQATGDVKVGGNMGFFWPGFVYLGTIARGEHAEPLPGTLSASAGISLMGDFNNVLPGDTAGASGIHFMTGLPLSMDGVVVTNANAWINFSTDALTHRYAGQLGAFYGGVRNAAGGIDYGTLPVSDFHTHPVDSSRW
nr:filamentous hemagglutinin N-terminal domain-containing protein [Oleiagrimonas sp. C23AA]